MSKIKINRKYNVPYVAGYSLDGTTLYIDNRLPKTAKIKGKTVDIDHYLRVHEFVEDQLELQFGMKYSESHNIALGAEKAAVELDGIDWNAYQEFYEPYYKECLSNFNSIPPDLDLEPYSDSKDTKTIEKMRKLGHDLLKEKK